MSTSSASIEKYDQEKGPDAPITHTHVVFADDGVNRTSGVLGKSTFGLLASAARRAS